MATKIPSPSKDFKNGAIAGAVGALAGVKATEQAFLLEQLTFGTTTKIRLNGVAAAAAAGAATGFVTKMPPLAAAAAGALGYAASRAFLFTAPEIATKLDLGGVQVVPLGVGAVVGGLVLKFVK